MIPTFRVTAKARRTKPAGAILFLGLLILSLLLSACGPSAPANSKDGNYSVPSYSGAQSQQQVADNPDFRNRLVNYNVKDSTGKDTGTTNFIQPTVQVYTVDGTVQLQTVRDFYRVKMPELGWTERNTALIDTTALGANGWVEGFVKENHVTGIIMVTPDGANKDKSVLKSLPPGSLPSDKNILIITQAVYTATPVANK